MANTEAMRIIQLTLDALDATVKAQRKPGVTPQQLTQLRKAELRLNGLHRRLVQELTKQRINALKRDAAALEKVNGQIKKSIKGLGDVAKKIDKAAKGVELVVKLLETAAKIMA